MVESSPKQEGMTMVQILSPRKEVLAAKEKEKARKDSAAAREKKAKEASETEPDADGEES